MIWGLYIRNLYQFVMKRIIFCVDKIVLILFVIGTFRAAQNRDGLECTPQSMSR